MMNARCSRIIKTASPYAVFKRVFREVRHIYNIGVHLCVTYHAQNLYIGDILNC